MNLKASYEPRQESSMRPTDFLDSTYITRHPLTAKKGSDLLMIVACRASEDHAMRWEGIVPRELGYSILRRIRRGLGRRMGFERRRCGEH
jgi:hypothetical protein